MYIGRHECETNDKIAVTDMNANDMPKECVKMALF